MKLAAVISFVFFLAVPTLNQGKSTTEEDRENGELPASVEKRMTHPNSTVCYEVLGCFDNFPPFDNADDQLPQSPDYINTTFLLYTRANAKEHDFEELSYLRNVSLVDSRFDATRMTRIIVHGFTNSGFTPWVQQMKDSFLTIEDSNVIIVNWHNGAVMPNYQPAVANTRLVGRQLLLLVKRLVSEKGLRLDRLHLIGHSLGAHTSGYVGRDLGGRVYRISGMDPAGPLFDHFHPDVDLDMTDAMFVDVIHSNGKPLGSGGAGLYTQVGHVDFYINGGKTQPGCKDGFSAVTQIFSQGLGDAVACSHERSHAVFLESITSACPFTAYPCTSYDQFEHGQCLTCGEVGCSELGLYADQHEARGMMFLKTRDHIPYCGFHYFVTIDTASDTRETKGQLSVSFNGTWGASDFAPVTEEEVALKASQTYEGIVVSSAEVGSMESLSIRYTKASAFLFFFGGGRNSVALDKVHVMSGESGKRFTFCLNGRELIHNQEFILDVKDANEC